MNRVILVGCGKEKAARTSLAKDLYTGQLFRAGRAFAEADGAPWFILSAKFGLLNPEDAIHPYDVVLADFSDEERAEWAHMVLLWQMSRQFSTNEPLEMVVLAGATYVEPLRWQLPEFPRWSLVEPMAGLQIGQRLQWFAQRRAA